MVLQHTRERRSRSLAALAVLALTLAAGASAAAAEPTGPPAPPVFPKGTFTLDSGLACTVAFGKADALPSLYLGVNYFVLDNLSLGAEVAGHGVFQPGDDTYAFGLSGVLRHHFLRWDDDTTLFADVSTGPFEAAADVPGAGTRFNFVSRAGLGITHRLDADTHLMAGARYWHLSNARIEGADRNPSVNGVEFYVGLVRAW